MRTAGPSEGRRRIDVLMVNDAEARQLGGEANVMKAATDPADYFPVKRGCRRAL
ncbi:MAG TPA: hypothetical protein VG496_17575 [Myxococcales bacterium]|nr:hypothetical protein [Myxococcales bacterium]